MKHTVSILALNNKSLTKRCIDSVIGAGDFSSVDLILTDNGCTDGCGVLMDSYATSYPNVRVVHNAKNLGFIEPNKTAFAMAKGDYFVLLNNDCVVPPGWLQMLEEPFLKHPKAALSGPVGGCQYLLTNFHGSAGAFEYLEGSCLMGKVSVLKQHGLFDPNLIGAYSEDSDLSLRMRELGYTIHQVQFHLQHTRNATSVFVPEAKEWSERNRAYCARRWAHYLRIRRFNYPIVVCRNDALGDVLLTTPIIRALKKRSPGSEIFVRTYCAGIFRNNPNVKLAERGLAAPLDSEIIPLDMAYEMTVNTSIIDAYARHASLTDFDRKPELFCTASEMAAAQAEFGGKNFIAVATGPSCWPSKEWPVDRFHALCERLMKTHKVVLVGTGKNGNFPCTYDSRNQTTIHQLAAMLSQCVGFIGLDSFPLHAAQAMGCPTVGLFGVTDPKYILSTTDRDFSVRSPAESFGVRHRLTAVQVCDDKRAAMNAISLEMVNEAVDRMLGVSVPQAELSEGF